jgi:hypothetical protein
MGWEQTHPEPPPLRRWQDPLLKTVASTRTPAVSTALILSLAGEALRWAFVGDSAFVVFRGGRLVFRSLLLLRNERSADIAA